MDQLLSDELLMSLTVGALRQPPEQREDWLRTACGDDTDLFGRVRQHLAAEMRMKDFLKRPFGSFLKLKMERQGRGPFEAGELAAGRFRIVRRVADGGMGVVYEGFDERLQRRVAIKCAKAGFGNRLPPEAKNAREVTHPGVCRIFDIHTASTAAGEIEFLSMEFLDGHTLAERLREGPLEKRTAYKIALQLCEGLAEAHRNHVVHGDLKSNNVHSGPAGGELPGKGGDHGFRTGAPAESGGRAGAGNADGLHPGRAGRERIWRRSCARGRSRLPPPMSTPWASSSGNSGQG